MLLRNLNLNVERSDTIAVKHAVFSKTAKYIASKQRISVKAASAILASGARKAGKKH